MGEEKEKPLTREDVLERIAHNDSKAAGLDFSLKQFEEGIDLRDIDIKRIILAKARLVEAHLEGANLREAHLEEANLRYAHLEGAYLIGTHLVRADLRDAHLKGAHLEEVVLADANLERADLSYARLERANLENANLNMAMLTHAHFEDAHLRAAHLEAAILDDTHLQRANLNAANLDWAFLDGAHLEGACLSAAILSPNTRLDAVDWGNYILAEEREGWFIMSDSYRRLKVWYSNAGIYEVAGEFFFREMTAKRKMLKWWPNPFPRVWSKLLSILCGYGERPLRVIGWAASVILGLALIYFIIGSIWEWSAFWNSLYFSSVSFTALGYGSWLHMPNDWIRGIGAFESFIGVFTIALFLVTFTRKMIR